MILLAVSGGIDSMCLAEKTRLEGGPFAIAHCNFALRGADSDADEALVRGWAERYGIPCHVRRFDTASYAAGKGASIEMAARELRYRWFGELCREHGYEAVAVAHNADDDAETMLLNLLRGSGVKGLSGMKAEGWLPVPEYRDIPLLRPLLGLTRAQIAAYVAEHGVPYREDRTNAENEFKRNKLRNQVFPLFREINPSFREALRRDREHIAEAGAVADGYYASHRDAFWDGSSVDLKALEAQEHPDYLLYRLLDEEGFAPYSIDKAREIFHSSLTRSGKKVIEGDREIVFSAGSILVRSLSRMAEVVENDDIAIVRTPGVYWVGGIRVEISLHPRAEYLTLHTAPGETLLDASAVPFPFIIRSWRPGDYMVPLGMRGRKKVSDLLSGADVREKERAVVLVRPGDEKRAAADRIAALIGIRPDASCSVGSGTQTVLQIVLR